MDNIKKYQNKEKLNKIIVTGTKGKTSLCVLIGYCLLQANKETLLVDSTGSYLNGKQVSNYEDSLRVFGKSPNIMPGRYLFWVLQNTATAPENIYAVLETAWASYVTGTGLNEHNVGIFTNIYRDHINFDTVKDENDLYRTKSFVFNGISEKGTFISSLDNLYTKKAFKEKVLKEKNAKKIGITQKFTTKEKLLELKNKYRLDDIFYLSKDFVYSLQKGKVFNAKKYKYYFNGQNLGMIENLLFSLAYLTSMFDNKFLEKAISNFLLPEDYGRNLVYKKKDNYVIVDYAHESVSIKNLVNVYNNYFKTKAYLITRVAPDRKNKIIFEYGKDIANLDISGLTIYDRIDGIHRKIYRWGPFLRKTGETSAIFEKAVKKANPTYKIDRTINEQEALLKTINKKYKIIIIIFSQINETINVLKKKGYKRIM